MARARRVAAIFQRMRQHHQARVATASGRNSGGGLNAHHCTIKPEAAGRALDA